jgi:acetamidase/formamidase
VDNPQRRHQLEPGHGLTDGTFEIGHDELAEHQSTTVWPGHTGKWLNRAPRLPSAGLYGAYTICSVARDLKINETVDLPSWLVLMTLPRGIFA